MLQPEPIADGEELEENPGLTLGLYALPGAELKAFHFTQDQVEEANGPGYWRLETGIEPEQTNGWLAFIDPFHLDSETLAALLERSLRAAAGDGRAGQRRFHRATHAGLFERRRVRGRRRGDFRRRRRQTRGVISQGCTPIGETWTLTRVEDNIIHEIGNRPAYKVLAETFNQLSPAGTKESRAAICSSGWW